MEGIITRSQSGFYAVATESGQIICELRGKLKKGRRTGDVAAVGDKVILSNLDDGSGMIEEIKPRHSLFTRLAPTPQGEYQQILIANLDQAVLVFACAEPAPRLGMLDRFLVISEKQGVPALVVANKIDLVSLEESRGLFGRYSSLGYTVLYTSAETGFGVEGLKEKVIGKLSLFTGPSGAGKSSLLNVIQPGLGLSVRQVSSATSKGKHTTVVRQMFALEEGGYVADTPGLKALALYDIEPEELDGYFPEMRPLVEECSFSDCTHVHEPGCGVLIAVKDGRVHPGRYQSYLRMRFGDDE
jgi:ribosome biogenesis GTPase